MSSRGVAKNTAVALAVVIVVWIASTLLSGCLSVARLMKLDACNGVHRWNEEKQEYVWQPCENKCDPLSKFGVYPTMQMRWQMLRLLWNWSPPKYTVQRRIALPVAEICLLPGAVVDVIVDTIALPWDWKYRGNHYDSVASDEPERLARSKCEFCGATSDGEFSLFTKEEDVNTPKWDSRYGVCQACIQNITTNIAYRFAE